MVELLSYFRQPSSSRTDNANGAFAQRALLLLVLAIGLQLPLAAQAEVLFEGYSKVMLSGEHVGYAIVRYEFDSKKQEFVMISLLHTNQKGGNINESTKARSGSALKPISYQYTSLVGGKAKTIDATFKGEEMTATVHDGDKPSVIKKTLPKGTFLSSFLAYLMLQGKEGIKPGTKYGYQAIAEEDASVSAGEAFVEKEEKVDGIPTFRILNTFKGSRFVSNVTGKGEVIATRSPVEGVSTELTATMQEAVGGDSFNSNTVKSLFGSIPKGADNTLARRAASSPATATAPVATGDAADAGSEKSKTLKGDDAKAANGEPKKSGVPAGSGLNLKTKTSTGHAGADDGQTTDQGK